MKSTRPFIFECTRCGQCCRWPGDVLLTDDDIHRLAAHLDLSEEAFIGRYTRLSGNRRGLSLSEKEDGSCVFLKDDQCLVYRERPRQCSDFPMGWIVPDGCPGITFLDES